MSTPEAPCNQPTMRSAARAVQRLRSGDLSASLDGPDLRDVRFGEEEVVRRLYLAVRDAGWGTVDAEIRAIDVDETAAGFRVDLHVLQRRGEIAFEWHGVILGTPDGVLSFEVAGVALADFQAARIGICVHHPTATCAGSRYVLERPGGATTGTFESLILPQALAHGEDGPPIVGLSALSLEPREGVRLRFEFEGAPFALEDQRNFTDTSFKSCPADPDELPITFSRGSRVRQRVRFTPTFTAPPRPRRARLRVELGSGAAVEPPALGVGLDTSRGLSTAEISLLRELRPSYLCAEVRTGGELETALDAAEAIGAQLEAVVIASDGAASIEHWNLTAAPLARLVVVEHGVPLPDPHVIAHVRASTGRRPVTTGAGSSIGFVAFSSYDSAAALAESALAWWRTDPQVHARDDHSIMENVAGVAETITTAAATLGHRSLSVAVGFGPARHPDARLDRPIAAAWLVGTAAHACLAPAHAVSWLQANGPGGLVEGGMPTPAFDALLGLRDVSAGGLTRVAVSDPLRVAALAGQHGGVLLANLSPGPVQVDLEHETVSLDGYEVLRRVR